LEGFEPASYIYNLSKNISKKFAGKTPKKKNLEKFGKIWKKKNLRAKPKKKSSYRKN
jgi:hypothetical protein